MNVDAWTLLAARSRAFVHQASALLEALTRPQPTLPDLERLALADEVAQAAGALRTALATVPELAAHQRSLQRFVDALAAWQQSVREAHPLERRYQTALLQQAAQALISGLHVADLAQGECARIETARYETKLRAHQGPA